MSPEPIPPGAALIVRGGRVMLPGADWHEPQVRDIAIAGDTIAGIADGFAAAAGAPIEELDARGHLVLPGFVNAHYHSHDVLAKGTLEEVPLETWRLYVLPPQYPPRSIEEVRARTLRCARMPALRHDHHSGHADALPVRRPPPRRGHARL
jgi:5-methylthioadenosine/S-adenosylhomocysteine deaminase